jgi:hypothetical protein
MIPQPTFESNDNGRFLCWHMGECHRIWWRHHPGDAGAWALASTVYDDDGTRVSIAVPLGQVAPWMLFCALAQMEVDK